MINLYYLLKYYECGHFCIKHVLKKDGIDINVEYNKQLMSLGLVCRVLKEYYWDVCCYKVEDILLLNNNKRFISLLKFASNRYHYIVIEKITSSHVFYYDPMFCLLKKKKIEKFKLFWSGFCCFFEKKK